MPRKAQPRIKRPSGIEQSANGKYFYWKCNISGLETFADEKRFKDVVKSYGSEDKLFKEYALRPAQKYIDAGFTPEYVRELAKGKKKLPRIDAGEKERKKQIKELKGKKRGRKPKLKSFANGETVETVVNSDGVAEEVVRKVYPWSNNPDYFKSEPCMLEISEATKVTCLFPNRYLDDACYGCPVYASCACKLKMGEEDWKQPKKKQEVKITPIRAFEPEEIES